MEEDKARNWRRIKDQRINKRVFHYDINVARTEKKVVKSARLPGDWLKTIKSNQVTIKMSAGAYHGVFLSMLDRWQKEEEFGEGMVTCRLVDIETGITMERAIGVDKLIRINMKAEEEEEVTLHCYNSKAKVLVQSKGAIRFANLVLEPKMIKAIKESKEEVDGINAEVLNLAVEKRKREGTPMVGPIFKCDHCGIFFNSRRGMTIHMRISHFSGKDSSFVELDEPIKKEDEILVDDSTTETVKMKYDNAESQAENLTQDNVDKAKVLAEKVVKEIDNVETSTVKVVDDKTKPEMVDSIETVKNMVKETVEDVLRKFNFTEKNNDDVNATKLKETTLEQEKSEEKGTEENNVVEEKKTEDNSADEQKIKENHIEEKKRKEDGMGEKKTKENGLEDKKTIEDVKKVQTIWPKTNIIDVLEIDSEEEDEKFQENKTDGKPSENPFKKPLKIGKQRENPVKPSKENVALCPHADEDNVEQFICERCEVKCDSIPELLHHVAESHEEGSMTNFLIYNLSEDNRKIKKDMKSIQLALEYVMRDNQQLQELNMETAVKLEAALQVLKKKDENHVKENVAMNVETDETKDNEPKDDVWIVIDEYKEANNVKKEDILWVGTSLSCQHLNIEKLALKTNTDIKKVKAFTIVKKDGKYNPELNIENVVTNELEKKQYDVVVVEVGVNEVSNLDTNLDPSLLSQEMIKKMDKLLLLATQWTVKSPGLKVVLLERMERIDSDRRSSLARVADQAMHDWWDANGKPENIIIENLKLQVRNRKERDEIYGRLGERNSHGVFNDGIHLRGKDGSKEFTHRASNLLRRVLGNRVEESKRFQEASKVKKGRLETRKKEEEKIVAEEKRKAAEKKQFQQGIRANQKKKEDEERKDEENRVAEEKRKVAEKWKRDEERTRRAEKRRREEDGRKREAKQAMDERKKSEEKEKRLYEEKTRRQNLIRQREEESKKRIRFNRSREEEKEKREGRNRRSDEMQQREDYKRQDFEVRKLEREARHAKREREERWSEREGRSKRNEVPRFVFDREGGRTWREGRTKVGRNTYKKPMEKREDRMREMNDRKREREDHYYSANYPPLYEAGNGKWGAPAPRSWA